MPVIRQQLYIEAPPELCFDLSRSIDVHMDSMAQTGERAVGGRKSGLIECGETVTWEAVHFGIRQRLTARITEMERPYRFVDEMVSGAFRRFYHEHKFEVSGSGTLVTDTFDYTSPLGGLGRLVDALFLERYMKRLLAQRNQVIRRIAEARYLEERD
ncbi:SRPBCC family protein [Paenibacillus puerhi]|uniref:SRPBCC family protein n=1 Tax=Paenibacillus puerhi TaxID=2692622 RepID=UPI001356D71F|nr:SRPBCC family protein [Paenibacillus puerhi]